MKYLAIIFFLFLIGCKFTSSNTNYVLIGKIKLIIELADTNETRQQGLMHRKSLEKNNGMLFVFEQKSILRFWMKNTLIPLSIAYIDEQCRIVDIQQMFPAHKSETNPKTYPSKGPALYALESNLNWFKDNNIKVGDNISIHSSKDKKYCNSEK